MGWEDPNTDVLGELDEWAATARREIRPFDVSRRKAEAAAWLLANDAHVRAFMVDQEEKHGERFRRDNWYAQFISMLTCGLVHLIRGEVWSVWYMEDLYGQIKQKDKLDALRFSMSGIRGGRRD